MVCQWHVWDADNSLLWPGCDEILTVWEQRKLWKSANHIIKLFKGSLNLSITAERAPSTNGISALFSIAPWFRCLNVTSPELTQGPGAMCTHVRSLGKTESGCECCAPSPSTGSPPPGRAAWPGTIRELLTNQTARATSDYSEDIEWAAIMTLLRVVKCACSN